MKAFITGFHHSGTSFLCEALESIGLSFGSTLDRHHEHEKLKAFDDALCRELVKNSGKSPRWGTASWTGPFRGPIRSEFAITVPDDVEAYKNPRLMVTGSLWHKQFPDAIWIYIYRDKHDVAMSMMVDKGRPQQENFWLDLQEEYAKEFTHFMESYHPYGLTISYAQLCCHPDHAAELLCEKLACPEKTEQLASWLKEHAKFKTYVDK